MKISAIFFFLSILAHSLSSQTITIGETNILSIDDSGNGDLICAQNATLDQPATILSLSFYVTVAAGNLRMGIYDATGPQGGPGVKQAETESIIPDTGWNTANVIVPVLLAPGVYWISYLPSSSSLAFRKDLSAGTNLAYYPYTFGTLPTIFPQSPNTDPYHWSFYATLTAGPDTIAPEISGVSVTSITQNSAEVSWQTNENSDTQIEYGLSDTYGFTTPLVPDLVKDHTQPLSGLTPSSIYHFRVISTDVSNNTAISGDYTFSTTGPDTIAPEVPTNLTASAISSAQIDLVWTPSTDNVNISGYSIERCTGAGCSDFTWIDTSPDNNYSNVGLTPNTLYRYRINAFDAGGNFSDYSNIAESTSLYPPSVKVGPTGRYLVDQNNAPFMMVGDSPQSLIVNLSPAEVEYYFANRMGHGFNCMWINLLCNSGTAGQPNGKTFDDIAPFNTPNDLATPNESYFARVDDYIHLAADHNLVVVLDPIETIGWLGTLELNGLAKAFDYGAYLGHRYKNFPNIIWMSGNDFQTWSNPVHNSLVQAVALGIQSQDQNHIHTAELNYLTSSTLNDPSWGSIISLNAAYTYYPTYAEVLHAYNQSSSTPVFMVEAHYELENVGGEMGTPNVLRRQEYWTMLSGATGQLYANAYTWQFLNNWQNNIDTRGVTELRYMRDFFSSMPWYDLVPDQSQTIITDGFGIFSSSGNVSESDYATSARTPDGKWVIAYIPTLRTITVDMTNLAGPIEARWYDPTSDTYSAINDSPLANTGNYPFTPPGQNSAGEDDWVLVLTSPDTTTSSSNITNTVDEEMKFYPNPMTTSSTLELNYSTANNEITIFDLLGNEIRKNTFSGNRMLLEKGNLEPGIYFVYVKTGERRFVKKIIVQ